MSLYLTTEHKLTVNCDSVLSSTKASIVIPVVTSRARSVMLHLISVQLLLLAPEQSKV